MFRHVLMISLFICIGFFSFEASAAPGFRTIDTASAQDVVDGMATKGVRGATNVLTGWVEFPKQIYVAGQEGGWFHGAVVGPLKGVGMTVARTVSGAGELFTFFLAYPGFYDPWLEPRFVWMKE